MDHLRCATGSPRRLMGDIRTRRCCGGRAQPCREDSRARASVWVSWGPVCRWSPTKKVGVPRAPLASALATSLRTLLRGVVVVEVAQELFDVEVEVGGVARDVLVLELVLVCEQEVVHLPEAPLESGGNGGLGG